MVGLAGIVTGVVRVATLGKWSTTLYADALEKLLCPPKKGAKK